MMSFDAWSTGLSIGLSLILAIGAQNAFVLRQGLRGEHVLPIVLCCALSDAVLIIAGVSGFRQLLEQAPWIDPVMRYGGAAFLLCYAARSLRAAFCSNERLVVATEQGATLRQAVGTCLALTWLNPHVYLDTLVLIGTISTRFPGHGASFAAGATTASFLFFFALGYGARLLRPMFAKPEAWRVLDGLIAIVMTWIAIKLVMGF